MYRRTPALYLATADRHSDREVRCPARAVEKWHQPARPRRTEKPVGFSVGGDRSPTKSNQNGFARPRFDVAVLKGRSLPKRVHRNGRCATALPVRAPLDLPHVHPTNVV